MLRAILRSGLKGLSAVNLARPDGADPTFTRQSLRHQSVVECFKANVPDRAARVLDIGCGEGGLSALLDQAGYTALHGCDWLPAEKVAKAPPGYDYRAVDLNADGLAGYASDGFDAVVCSDVIEHLENAAFALREIARVLSPGATAIISLPNAFNLLERVSWLATGNSTRYKRELSVSEFGHISIIPRDVMHSLAARAGLNVVGTQGGYAYMDGYVLMPSRVFSPSLSYNIIWILQKPAK